MRILTVACAVPFPPVGGGNSRTYWLLRALAGRHELTLVAFSWGERSAAPPFAVRVVDVPWELPPLYEQMQYGEDAVSAAALQALSAASVPPFYASFYESPALAETLHSVGREGFDVVLIEGSYMARHLDALPADVPKVVDFLDLHSLMTRREAESAGAADRAAAEAEAARTIRYERQVAARCNACLTVSEDEAAAARALLGVEHVHVVPNGVDSMFFAPSGARPVPGYLLFTGTMDYPPNVDAACHFTREIFPLVRRQLPGAAFHVVGRDPVPAVRELTSDGVVVHGAVPDMRPFFRDAEVVVAPVRRGGGTRLKILEAAASGKAVVSTRLGAEGLAFRPGDDLILADAPEAFAEAVLALSGDNGRRQELERRARLAAEPYDWKHSGRRLRTLLETLG